MIFFKLIKLKFDIWEHLQTYYSPSVEQYSRLTVSCCGKKKRRFVVSFNDSAFPRATRRLVLSTVHFGYVVESFAIGPYHLQRNLRRTCAGRGTTICRGDGALNRTTAVYRLAFVRRSYRAKRGGSLVDIKPSGNFSYV